ncbi:MarR family transcriptional regulator [Streptacidiphilus sp. 4-A2]|nr:MarR family transcriptional regulator [Streptacidiphilus sp. 4-A2]
MPTTTVTLNGQVIGQAHYATRAVLEGVLARTGTTFAQSLALNYAASADPAIEHEQLVARITGGLKVPETEALATVRELTGAGLLEAVPGEAARLRVSEAGRALSSGIRAETDRIVQRLYGDVPAGDLAVAGRVLTLVTERANAELAAAQQ